MKYPLLVPVALAIFNINIQAQSISDSREKIRFGVKAGGNYSNVYDTQGEAFDANARLGLVAGVFMAIPIGKWIGIQPEVLFSQKGFQGTGRILGGNYDFTRTTSYIDVPIFFAVKPVKFLTLVAGPQFSYLLKQRDVFANGVTTIEQETAFKNDNIRKNTLGFIGGLNLNFNHLVIGARAGWDVLNNNGNGTSATPRYKNAWVQATVGYQLY